LCANRQWRSTPVFRRLPRAPAGRAFGTVLSNIRTLALSGLSEIAQGRPLVRDTRVVFAAIADRPFRN